MQQKPSKDSVVFNEQSDHKVTIHHIPINTLQMTSYGSRPCEATHRNFVLNHKGKKMLATSMDPKILRELLTDGVGDSKVDEEPFGDGFPLWRGARTGLPSE